MNLIWKPICNNRKVVFIRVGGKSRLKFIVPNRKKDVVFASKLFDIDSKRVLDRVKPADV